MDMNYEDKKLTFLFSNTELKSQIEFLEEIKIRKTGLVCDQTAPLYKPILLLRFLQLQEINLLLFRSQPFKISHARLLAKKLFHLQISTKLNDRDRNNRNLLFHWNYRRFISQYILYPLRGGALKTILSHPSDLRTQSRYIFITFCSRCRSAKQKRYRKNIYFLYKKNINCCITYSPFRSRVQSLRRQTANSLNY